MAPCLRQFWPIVGRHRKVRGVLFVRISHCAVFLLLLLNLVLAPCLSDVVVAQEELVPASPSPAAVAEVPAPAQVAPQPAPDILQMPFEPQTPADIFAEPLPRVETAAPPQDLPRGYTGATGIRPSESQQTLDFVPVEDHWRIGFPDKDRYGDGNTPGDDRLGEMGRWWDPYNQNVLKGDY
ncbi:MAG: hypothetical protein ACKPJJ_16850, partial [Planctomycetaceae bacterium]